MKIRNLVWSLGVGFLVWSGLANKALAYNNVSCSFYHEQGFDWGDGFRSSDEQRHYQSFAVLKNKAGLLDVTLPILNPTITADNYELYIYVDGQWSRPDYVTSSINDRMSYLGLGKNNISFDQDKTYALAAFFKDKDGNDDYYCSGKALVFGQETAVTEYGWLDNEQSVSDSEYVSPAIFSSSGKKIGAVAYRVSSFEGDLSSKHFMAANSLGVGYGCEKSGRGEFFVAHALSGGCGSVSSSVNFFLRSYGSVSATVDFPVLVYTISDQVEAAPMIPEEIPAVLVGDIRVNSYKENGQRKIGVEIDGVRAGAGDSIKEVYLKMADPLSGWVHVESNLIPRQVWESECVGKQQCNIRAVYEVPDSIGQGSNYVVWVVVKSNNGSVCTDKPGVADQPRCGAGVRTVGLGPVEEELPTETPIPEVLEAGQLTVNGTSLAIGDNLNYSFEIKALGQRISEVYLKLGSLETGEHIVANILEETEPSIACNLMGCYYRGYWKVPDNEVIRRYLGKPLAMWLVVKTDKMACSDKPGVEAQVCGAGVEKIVVGAIEPTPTIVERIVAAVEEVVIRPIRKTAAQIVGEYFESQQNQQVVSVSEPEVDENSVIYIPEPNWNIFGW